MSELGTVYVDVKGDYSGLEQQTKSKFGSLAKIGAGVFAAGFVGQKLFDFGAAAVDASSDLAESANALAQTFTGEALAGIQEFGAGAAETMGLAESDFNMFAVQFGGFAKQIAGSGGDVAGVMSDVGTRVADFASVMNLDVNDAAREFQSIMAGSSEVARKYGLDVSAAAVEQFAMENGLAKSKSEMTEAVKVQARYGILMQQTEQWAGDFANTSDELANSQRIAKASFADVQAELGSALLPVLGEVVGLIRTSVVPLFSKLQPIFVMVAEAIAQLAEPVIELVGAWVPLVTKLLPPLVKILTKVMDIFLALAIPIIDLIVMALDPLMEALGPLIDELLMALMPAIEALADLIVALSPLLELVVSLLKPIFKWVGFVAQILGEMLGASLKVVIDYIADLIEWLQPAIDWLINLADTISSTLGEILPGILDWFKNLPGLLGDLLSNAGTWLLETGKDIIQGLIDGIMDMAGSVVDAISDTISGIPGAIKNFFGIASPSKLMKGFGLNITQGLADGIYGGRKSISKAVSSLLRTPSLGGFGVPVLPPVAIGGVGGGGGGLSVIVNGPVAGNLRQFADDISAAQAREQRYKLG